MTSSVLEVGVGAETLGPDDGHFAFGDLLSRLPPMGLLDRLVASGYRHGVKGTGRVAAVIYGHALARSVPARLNDLQWEADPLDWMDQQILKTGTYEPEISDLLTELVGHEGVLWDVGANAGVHAITVATRARRAVVVAFEPSPMRFARLCRNASLNRANVQAYCVALADRRGYQNLSIVDTGNSGLTSLIPWPDIDYTSILRVWCDTGDEMAMLEHLPWPTVIKVDVEGAEFAVFSGMPRVLVNQRLQHVVFEAGPDPNSEAMRLLEKSGFAIQRLASTGGGVDWLATRNPRTR